MRDFWSNGVARSGKRTPAEVTPNYDGATHAVCTAEATGITLIGVGRADEFGVFEGAHRISRTSAHGLA
jgi:hypothetical protein